MLMGRGQKVRETSKSTAGSAALFWKPLNGFSVVLGTEIDPKPSVPERWSPLLQIPC